MREGFVFRYSTNENENENEVDGLPGRDSPFIACSFWMVDALALSGRHDDARAMFERVLSVRNDVGLLAEGYDIERRRLVGNFPQAFFHVGVVNAASLLGCTADALSHRSAT